MPSIKSELHELIDSVEDNKVLEAVHTLLSNQVVAFSIEGKPLKRGDYEASVDEGERDILASNTHSHEEVKTFFKQKMGG